MRCTTA